jgi:glycosyltransferase involved in cell wall biosynthesis
MELATRSSTLSEGRLRLLFLVPYPPRLDARHGGARAVANIVAMLAVRHEVAVLYLRGSDEQGIDERLRAACRLVVELPRVPAEGPSPRIRHGLGTLLRQLRGVPYWPAAVGGAHVRAGVDRIAREWRPDVAHLEFLPMGQFAPMLRARGAAVVLTPYESYAEAAAERSAAASGVAGALASWQLSRWRAYERRVAGNADAIVALTPRDEAWFAHAADAPRPTRVVRIPLRIPLPDRPLDARGASPPSVLFVGNFLHPPNADAALRLVRDIMPRVWRELPEARVVIVGPHPPGVLRAAANDRVEITGEVTDVNEALARAAVVAAPLLLGAGMRVKVLEAIAAGKAVVATPRALEGLDVLDREQVRVADDDAAIARAIAELLRSPDTRASLGARAYAWAREALDPARWADEYDALYRRLLAARVRVPGARAE